MDDLEFLQRLVKGDRRTQDEFLRRYSRLIYRYIHSTLKVKRFHPAQEQAEDIFQEILCLLIKDNFKKIKSFRARNGCSLASWLRVVAINFTIDYLRRTRPAISLDGQTEEGLVLKDILADSSAVPDDMAVQNEKYASLKDCIKRLGKDDKYLVRLHIHGGLGQQELSKLLRISRAAVDMRKSRLIQRLRDCFRSKGFKLDF